MPPTTTPARTTIVSRRAKSGVTSGFCTVRITLTVAARSAETRTAEPITRSARTPSRRAVRKSIAAARMCRPDRRPLEQKDEEEQADRRRR